MQFFEGKIVYSPVPYMGDLEAYPDYPFQDTADEGNNCTSSSSLENIIDPHLTDSPYEVIEVNKTRIVRLVAQLDVTDLRIDPYYSAYTNWSRLIVLGIVPFALLVFFNTKIYKDIRERRKRRLR